MEPRSHLSLTEYGIAERDDPERQHNIFLSHSGVQKDFVEQLCLDLQRCHRFPFFDKLPSSLPYGEEFPDHIFNAIKQCRVGVLILSEEFFVKSKWPMLEFAAMEKEFKAFKTKSRVCGFEIKIIPVYFGISLEKCRDPSTKAGWIARWKEWANVDKRINAEEWEKALKILGPLNSLVFKDGTSHVEFREKIVRAICKASPPEIKLEDDHVQGKLRICKDIYDFIYHRKRAKKSTAHVVGLYGVSGIGKTTICKVLCNEFFDKFCGRVCHIELKSFDGQVSHVDQLKKEHEKELLHKILTSFTDNDEFLHRLKDVTQYYFALKNRKFRPLLLAIDNVSDDIEQAKTILSIKNNLDERSIIILTARSFDHLNQLICKDECLEMPELKANEAKQLFLYHVKCDLDDDIDDDTKYDMEEELLARCVERCHFSKGQLGGSHHYHPLALEVLGKQFCSIPYDPERWAVHLQDVDAFNESRKRPNEHPVFSILRKSFDMLLDEDRLLFMDAAIFVPNNNYRSNLNGLEWLGMVHGTTVDIIKQRLESLRKKSLLGSLDYGFLRIGIHDLWREFSRAEMTVGECGDRTWTYEVMRKPRMRTIIPGHATNLKSADFAEYFSKVTVLKLECRFESLDPELDLSSLKHLRSLDIQPDVYRGRRTSLSVKFGNVIRSLVFLNLSYIRLAESEEIGQNMTKLQYLQLHTFRGSKFPDITKLTSLQVICFRHSRNVDSVTGLTSRLTNLQILDLDYCSSLESCPGVGALIRLRRLQLGLCKKLKELPDLQNLKNLRILEISRCPLITTLHGLHGLVNLEELRAWRCTKLAELLPDLQNLAKLKVLDLAKCPLKAIPGLRCLTSLEDFRVGLTDGSNFPLHSELTPLSNLQNLELESQEWTAGDVAFLAQLKSFTLSNSCVEILDLQTMTSLQKLIVSGCEFRHMTGLCTMTNLESLEIKGCTRLEALPDLSDLKRLQSLEVTNCHALSHLDACRVTRLTSLERLKMKGLLLQGLPDIQSLTRLTSLNLSDSRFSHVRASPQVKQLNCSGLPITDLKLDDFPELTELNLLECGELVSLSTSGPSTALEELILTKTRVKSLPDLSNFPRLKTLDASYCKELEQLQSSGPMIALQKLVLEGCRCLRSLPDLRRSKDLCNLALSGSGVVLTQSEIDCIKALNAKLQLDVDLDSCSDQGFMQVNHDIEDANSVADDRGTCCSSIFPLIWGWLTRRSQRS